LATYSLLLKGIVNPGALIPPLMNEEAVISSKIEATQAAQLLRRMKDAGLLSEIREARGQRPAVLCFPELPKTTEA